eukprot:40803-Rhodomonas_salina.1
MCIRDSSLPLSLSPSLPPSFSLLVPRSRSLLRRELLPAGGGPAGAADVRRGQGVRVRHRARGADADGLA